MEKNPWTGRLGIEVIGKMAGCCIETIAKWRPQMIGLKRECSYCNSFMKTIRAGEVLSPVFTGGMLEHHVEVEEPELSIGGLYFSSSKFPTEKMVERWMADRDMEGEISKIDEHAFFLPVGEPLFADSIRMVWVAPGVVGEVGVSEKQVATGGGQASMSSPGITTTSMASGGELFPAQGIPAEASNVPVGVSPMMQGLTDVQDGHQHEFFLTPVNEVSGLRVKSFTSYNNGHAHMVECAVDEDGTIDTRTAPDQAPVGGHAHSHRLVWPIGKSFGEDDRPYERQYRVSSSDVALLRKAATMIGSFCSNINGGRGVREAVGDIMTQMSAAIERARGESPGVEAVIPIRSDVIERLQGCMREIGNIEAEIAGILSTTKAWGVETEVSPRERGKYSGRSLGSLRGEYNDLTESGPHKEGSAEWQKMKELSFAIRAKTGWGKVSGKKGKKTEKSVDALLTEDEEAALDLY